MKILEDKYNHPLWERSCTCRCGSILLVRADDLCWVKDRYAVAVRNSVTEWTVDEFPGFRCPCCLQVNAVPGVPASVLMTIKNSGRGIRIGEHEE